jgi:hypothetical protein
MVPLLLLLGASWYYYLRTLGKHTPGFTAFGSFLFVLFFAIFNEFCNPFTTDYKYAVQNILIYSAVGLVGIVIFAAVYYFSRTPKQRKARRKQVEEIWGRNARLVKRIRGKKN